MNRGLLATALTLAFVLAAPLAAHAEAVPPADPPPADPAPYILPAPPSTPYVPPAPTIPEGDFTPSPLYPAAPPDPPRYVTWEDLPPESRVPRLTGALGAAMMAVTLSSGISAWDVQFNDDGTLLMKPFGSDEPWRQVSITGTKLIGNVTPAPGTQKIMWDVTALLSEHQLKYLEAVGERVAP